MGNGNHGHQSINNLKIIYLPMFCRLSIQDVKLNSVPIAAAGTSSPKVSCIGQVKRNSRVIGYPTTTTSIAAAAYHHKHIEPKKILLPAKTLPPNSGGSGSCRTTHREVRVSDFRKSKCGQDCEKVAVNISEMDPPLPVVKRVAPPGVVSIWKRRFDGRVKLSELEPIHLPTSVNFHQQHYEIEPNMSRFTLSN